MLQQYGKEYVKNSTLKIRNYYDDLAKNGVLTDAKTFHETREANAKKLNEIHYGVTNITEHSKDTFILDEDEEYYMLNNLELSDQQYNIMESWPEEERAERFCQVLLGQNEEDAEALDLLELPEDYIECFFEVKKRQVDLTKEYYKKKEEEEKEQELLEITIEPEPEPQANGKRKATEEPNKEVSVSESDIETDVETDVEDEEGNVTKKTVRRTRRAKRQRKNKD